MRLIPHQAHESVLRTPHPAHMLCFAGYSFASGARKTNASFVMHQRCMTAVACFSFALTKKKPLILYQGRIKSAVPPKFSASVCRALNTRNVRSRLCLVRSISVQHSCSGEKFDLHTYTRRLSAGDLLSLREPCISTNTFNAFHIDLS